MRYALATLVLLALLACPSARACGRPDLNTLARNVLSPRNALAQESIELLREMGPAGLDALFTAHQSAIDAHRQNPDQHDENWDRLAAALDGVAAQRDAWAAHLYWYTDLEAAKKAAAESNKPILSLRLLGTLDTEFSCANSRFFRTVLYPNETVRSYLRQNFILHWQSHRPVPRLTIDFGDGRIIERTITGNSVHYVLTPTGKAVDVIPGLYGPAAFLRALEAARPIAMLPPGRMSADRFIAYHQQRAAAIAQAFTADLKAVDAMVTLRTLVANDPQAPQPAIKAARIAPSKSMAEAKPILAMTRQPEAPAEIDDATWAKIAAKHAPDAALDDGSRAVIASKATVPKAIAANNRTDAKRKIEDPTLRLVRNFERSVAEDTVRNEYLLHSQVHQWFASGAAPMKLDDLNEKVYAELFLMPKSDPFLGLIAPDTYTALPDDASARR